MGLVGGNTILPAATGSLGTWLFSPAGRCIHTDRAACPHPTQAAASRPGVLATVALQLVAWTSRPGVTVGSGTSSSGSCGLTGRQRWQTSGFLITYVIVTLRHHCYKPSGRATRLYNSDYCTCVDAATHSGAVNAIKLVKP